MVVSDGNTLLDEEEVEQLLDVVCQPDFIAFMRALIYGEAVRRQHFNMTIVDDNGDTLRQMCAIYCARVIQSLCCDVCCLISGPGNLV